MSFWRRLNPFQRAERRSGLLDPAGWLYDALSGGGRTHAGVRINERNAMTLSAVWACVRVLSEGVAALPFPIYRRTGENGRERERGNPAYALLNAAANDDMTAMVFRETMQAHLLTWGRAVAEIEWAGNGRPMALWPITPDRIRILRDKNGRLVYEVNGASKTVVLQQEDVLHVPGLGFDGVESYSPIRMARQSLGLGMAAETFGAAFYGNGARPGGTLESPDTLTPDQKKNLRESWQAYVGSENTGKVALLEKGIKYNNLTIPPDEAQFLETRKFQVTEIARWYKVPPHMIGDLDHATFSNIEHQGIEFVVHSLRPWLVRWEQEVNRKIFGIGSSTYAEHVVDGLLRGDTLTRYQAYEVAIRSGWMLRSEPRVLENLNPVDGLDRPLIPMNMAVGSDPEADKTVAFNREIVKAFIADGTVADVIANATKITDLVKAAGLPTNTDYKDPWLPVKDDQGNLVTGEPIKDSEGDVVGSGVVAPIRPPAVPALPGPKPDETKSLAAEQVDVLNAISGYLKGLNAKPVETKSEPFDVMRTATRDVLVATAARMMKRLATHAKKNNGGGDWIDEHRTVIADAMVPAVISFAGVRGLTVDAAAVVTGMVDAFESDVAKASDLDAILAAYDGAAESWVALLERGEIPASPPEPKEPENPNHAPTPTP
jgi:HK97 family phage portal protein